MYKTDFSPLSESPDIISKAHKCSCVVYLTKPLRQLMKQIKKNPQGKLRHKCERKKCTQNMQAKPILPPLGPPRPPAAVSQLIRKVSWPPTGASSPVYIVSTLLVHQLYL